MRSLVSVSCLTSAALALTALSGCRSEPERVEVEVEPVLDADPAPAPRVEGGPPIGLRESEASFDTALEADGPRWRPSTDDELPAASSRVQGAEGAERATRLEAIERLEDLEEPAEPEAPLGVADAPPPAAAGEVERDRDLQPRRERAPPLQAPSARAARDADGARDAVDAPDAVGRGRWEEPRSRARELQAPEPLPELEEDRAPAFGAELEREDLEDLRRRVSVEDGREVDAEGREADAGGLAGWAVIVAILGGLLAGAAAVFLWVRTHGSDYESA